MGNDTVQLNKDVVPGIPADTPGWTSVVHQEEETGRVVGREQWFITGCQCVLEDEHGGLKLGEYAYNDGPDRVRWVDEATDLLPIVRRALAAGIPESDVHPALLALLAGDQP